MLDWVNYVFNSILNNKFFKQASTLVSGTAIAQLLILAVSPILSRLYTPDDFGVFSIYSSLVVIIVVIASFRYEHAIILPKEKKQALNLVMLSLSFCGLTSIILFFIYLLVGDHIVVWLEIEGDSNWMYLVPISIFLMGSYSVLNFWMTRITNYKAIAKSQVFRSISLNTAQTSGGILNLGHIGLIGGQIIGLFVYTTYLFGIFIKEEMSNIKKYVSKDEMLKVLSEYKDFPAFSAPQALMNSISQNMLPFTLAIFYTPTVVGWYALSLKLLKMPVDVLGNAIKQVFLQKSAQTFNNNKKGMLTLYLKTTFILFLIGIIPAIILFYSSPVLFSVVMGEQWVESGLMARWMVIWLFLVFVSRPTVVLFQIFRIQKMFFVFEFIGFWFKLSILVIFGLFCDAFFTIKAFSIFNGIYYCFLMVYIYYYIKRKIR